MRYFDCKSYQSIANLHSADLYIFFYYFLDLRHGCKYIIAIFMKTMSQTIIIMKSKGYQRFKNRIQYFTVDKELIDVIRLNQEVIAGDTYIFNRASTTAHPQLCKHSNTTDTRNKVISHIRNTLYVSFVKEQYEEVTEYFRYILIQGAIAYPDKKRLLGEHKISIDANSILTNTYDKIVEMIGNDIFQQLENEKSTVALITKIIKKLNLNVETDVIEDAMPYLLIRHIFVHSDGKPNDDFKNKYPQIKLNTKGRISLTKTFLENARIKVDKLLQAFDADMIAKGYFPASELQP